MKRIFSIVLTLALICSCVAISAVSVSATGPNLLGDTSKWVAGDWSISTATQDYTITKRAIYDKVIDVEPGASYTFTFNTNGQWYKLIARTYDADGNIIGTLSGIHGTVGKDNKKTTYTETVTITEGVYKLGIGVYKTSDETDTEGANIIKNINNGTFQLSIVKNVATETHPIEMLDGASMRIDSDTNGIRFEASVKKSDFDAKVDGGTVTEIGTLIAKEDAKLDDVIVDNAVEVTSSGKDIGDKIPVAKYAEGTTMQTAKDTNYYIIVGSLVEINENHATQKYVARAYVKYVDKTGGEHVIYANALSTPRSIAEVAHNIVTADSTDGYYSSLCQKHKDVVDAWAKEYKE